MRNEQVVIAWLNGHRGAAGNLSTDGKSLYSYNLCIGHTGGHAHYPVKVVRDYTSSGEFGFVSMTTSHHVGLAKRLA